MIAGGHFPTYDFDDNRDFAIDHPEVINELMNTEIIASTPPRPKFVHTKVARATEPQEITPFQCSRHTHTYEWWIKNYPGVPYLRTPCNGGSRTIHGRDVWRTPNRYERMANSQTVVYT